ncbi:MAG: stage III sporulation protein AC [Clostridia bacterium]|nr:stage III sporulation protein AC [Clostridia bacterium]
MDILYRIMGVGFLTSAVSWILNRAGREELATLSTVAGLAIVLLSVLDTVSELLTQVRTIFQLY